MDRSLVHSSGHQGYYAWGYGGQFIVLVPDLELVVVSTSSAAVSDERRTHRRTVDEIIEYLTVEPIARRAASAGPEVPDVRRQ